MKFNLFWKNKFPVLEHVVEAPLHMVSTIGSKLKFNRDFPVHVTRKKTKQKTHKINKTQERARFRFPGIIGIGKKIKTGTLNTSK